MNGLILLAALGTGIGGWLLAIAVRPRPVRLDKALAALSATPVEVRIDAEPDRWATRLGQPAVRLLTRLGLPTASTRRDLTAIGKPVQAHLAEQSTAALVGLILPVLLTVLLKLADIELGLSVPVGGGLILAAVLFFTPELSVRSEAAKLRASFRHSLGAFLDLVVVSMAGGAGVDQALDDAASVGSGAAMAEIRYALQEARLARIAPWDTLAALGARIGVPELQQLASTVGLAGTEGARVRTSLRSRAQAMRTRQITDAEAAAESSTESMSVGLVLFFGGFFILLSYPAVAAILGGL